MLAAVFLNVKCVLNADDNYSMIFMYPRWDICFMGKTNLSDYKKIYLQTAKEYIGNIISSYAKLSANSADHESINTVHISSHSLRSQSQVMGYVNIAGLSEKIEKKSSEILNGVIETDAAFLSLLKESIDKLNLEIAQLEKGDAS
jgi:chemotaxis protein histidine kinase CheA